MQIDVCIHIGDWVEDRLKNLSEKDKIRFNSRSKSGFVKNISNWMKYDIAYPTNVLHLVTECSNKNHSAVFPESLPEWFINLFTEERDTVLDPFMGSGRTLKVTNRFRRNSIGIDIVPEYYEMVKSEIKKREFLLFESKAKYERNKFK